MSSSNVAAVRPARSFGIMKDRTLKLAEYKKDKRRSELRFSKKTKDPLLDTSLTNGNQNLKLLDQKSGFSEPPGIDFGLNSSPHTSIASHATSAPGWMEIYEDSLQKLKEVESIYKDFLKCKEQRIKNQFGKSHDLDTKIEDLCRQATYKLSLCEQNITAISRDNADTPGRNQDKKMKENLQKALASKVSELAKQFRVQEKNLFDFLVKLGGDKDETRSLKKAGADFGDESSQEMDAMEELNQERDEQVNKLVGTINQLATLFKQMNLLVIEQGTILDRIDYNMEDTLHNTKKANIQLKKANEELQSGFAAKCKKILLVLIAFFTVLYVLKKSF